MERDERGGCPESAVFSHHSNDSHHHQESIEHDRDRETIESSLQQHTRILARSFEGLALERHRQLRFRQPHILVQAAARNATDSTDQLRERLPIGRHDRSGERKMRTAEGSIARKSRSSCLKRRKAKRSNKANDVMDPYVVYTYIYLRSLFTRVSLPFAFVRKR